MHFCMNEILILSLIINLLQTGGFYYLFQKITEARAITQKFRQRLIDRPIKTIIYGKRE